MAAKKDAYSKWLLSRALRMARPGGFEPPTLGSEDRVVAASKGVLWGSQAKTLLLFAIIAMVLLSNVLSAIFSTLRWRLRRKRLFPANPTNFDRADGLISCYHRSAQRKQTCSPHLRRKITDCQQAGRDDDMVTLDTRHCPTSYTELARGSPHETIMHPREIFKAHSVL